MQRLVIATRSVHKTREFAQLLGDGFAIRDLTSYAGLPQAVENGETFEENAISKALITSESVSGLVLADDSGLEVDALGGAPGIFSARYAGENATDAENVEKLLHEMSSISGPGSRRARFRCVLAIARCAKLLGTVQGCIEGDIASQPRGEYGFGYDPVFVPAGFDQTFAEMPAKLKNELSHRARAAVTLRDTLGPMGANFA